MKKHIKNSLVEIVIFIYLLTLFGVFFLFFEVKEYGDSFQLLNQFATRDPGYSIFLKICRDLFGEEHYYGIIGFVQNALAIASIWCVNEYVGKRFNFPKLIKVFTVFLLTLPHIITPLASSTNLILTNSILTEGVSISIFNFWMILMMHLICEDKWQNDLAALGVAFLLSLVRGQLMVCMIGWLVVAVIKSIVKKKVIRIVCSIFLIILLLGGRTAIVRNYNNYFWNLPVDTFSSKAMMISNVLYVAEPEDVNGIETPYLQEIFLDIINMMQEDGICYEDAQGSPLEKALFHNNVHDRINFDYFEPVAREYLKRTQNLDEMEYMKLMYHVDIIAGELMGELLPTVLERYVSNYLLVAGLGLVRSIAVELASIVPLVVFLYALAIAAGLYTICNKYRRKDKNGVQAACILLFIVMMIFGNAFATALMLQCISRYMIYNFPFFYIGVMGLLISWKKSEEGNVATMSMAFRIDDVTADLDWDKFEAVMNILSKYEAWPLLGVVPQNEDVSLMVGEKKSDFWEYLHKLQQSGCCIAMHGCYHQYVTDKKGMFPLNAYSEFAGRSVEEQEQIIEHGKKCLEEHGISTDIFMPPAHSFDKNTVKILKEKGFNYITDGFGMVPYERMGMTFVPICVRTQKAWKKEKGTYTVVLHTNTMSDESINNLENTIKQNREKVCAYKEFLSIQPVQRDFIGNSYEYITAFTKHIAVKVIGVIRRKRRAGAV